MTDQSYSKTELMISVAARLFQDGTTAFIGTGIPMLAAMLATKTLAPNLVPVFEFGGLGAIMDQLPRAVGEARTVWRGMASGTRKDRGFFWLGVPTSRQLVLCGSAIDAISYCQMHPDCLCLSTSGVRANPAWVPALITRGYEIHCGFDADDPGDAAADRMITLHPPVLRLRPSAHHWNDVLTSRR